LPSLFVIVGKSLESEGDFMGQSLADLVAAILVRVIDELPKRTADCTELPVLLKELTAQFFPINWPSHITTSGMVFENLAPWRP